MYCHNCPDSSRRTAHQTAHQRYRGFTLVEMMVVIGIIAVLAGILFPVMGRVRQGGQRTVCLNNMKQLGLAFQQYVIDHDARYPGAGQLQKWGNGGHWVKGVNGDVTQEGRPGSLYELTDYTKLSGSTADVQGGALYPYVKNPNVYVCPSQPDGADVTGLTYSMNCAIGGMSSRTRLKTPSEINLLIDEAYANDGFFYIDNPATPTASTSTDALSQFHLKSGNVLFADGHVRSYTYDQYPLSKDRIDIKQRDTGVPRFWDKAFDTTGPTFGDQPYYNPTTAPFGTCVAP